MAPCEDGGGLGGDGLADGRLAARVAALSRPAAYPHRPAAVGVVETHMSFVFLAGPRVYKLKKPVRSPRFDFTTLSAREANCRAEVRLNRRLAPDTYLGVAPLTREADGTFAVAGAGDVEDWLVVMRRLPEERMLHRLLSQGRVSAADLDRLAAALVRFYRTAARPRLDPAAHVAGFVAEAAINRAVILRFRENPALGGADRVLDRFDARLAAGRGLIEARVRAARIVDGHGDLKPEHVCLTEPVVVFDCLEFSRALRLVDPFDEVAFLGMECALIPPSAGAGPRGLAPDAVGPCLATRLAEALGDRPDARLTALYAAFRALLRARLSLAHLLDPTPREPERWGPQAARYLAFADAALDGAGAS